jgi:hypothetical protein
MVKVARPCLKNSKKGLGYGSNGRELPYHAWSSGFNPLVPQK